MSAQPDRWRAALTAVEQEQRRIVQYGVRQDELDRELKEVLVQLEQAAAGAGTRRTPRIANEITGTLDDGLVYTNPVQDLAMFREASKGLTAQTVSDALKQVFGPEFMIAKHVDKVVIVVVFLSIAPMLLKGFKHWRENRRTKLGAGAPPTPTA